jgi:hypothetical protein
MSGVVITASNPDKETLNQMIRSARVERGEISQTLGVLLINK